jgi:hypothetical protein
MKFKYSAKDIKDSETKEPDPKFLWAKEKVPEYLKRITNTKWTEDELWLDIPHNCNTYIIILDE